MKIANTLLMFLILTSLNAQNKKTLFELGSPTTSPDINFSNFFKNFPVYVENSNAINFIGYKFIATIKRHSGVIRYLRKNYKENSNIGIVQIEGGSDSIFKNILTNVNHISQNNISRKYINHILDIQSANISNKTYKVYSITYMIDNQQRNYYVFIDPTSNRIIKEGNLFAFEIFPNMKYSLR